MEIKLKDLVWKEIDQIKELNKLVEKYNSDKFIHLTSFGILNEYAEEFIKEREKIENKQTEYTKQDIIDMFVEAGLEYEDGEYQYLKIKDDSHRKKIIIRGVCLYFDFDFNGTVLETRWIDFNDRKSIEFYYNKFREILEFEANNDLE